MCTTRDLARVKHVKSENLETRVKHVYNTRVLKAFKTHALTKIKRVLHVYFICIQITYQFTRGKHVKFT